MDWLITWPVFVVAGYLFVYISLYLGCRICSAPDASAGRLAAASVAPFILLAAYGFWFISALGALKYLSGGPVLFVVFMAPVFLAMLIGAPWLLRPGYGESWGPAWGGAALGGVFLCILVTFAWSAVGEISHQASLVKAKAEKTGALAAYGLPCPPDAEFDAVRFEISSDAIAHARQDPDFKRWSPAWVDRWPCNETISFKSNQSPGALADFLEKSLGQAGFTVRRSGTEYVTGAKDSLFAAYQIQDGKCLVRVWKDFAREMEAVSAAEM